MEFMGITIDATGIETAGFLISNRSSQDLTVMGELTTKSQVPESAWSVLTRLPAHECDRLTFDVPTNHGELMVNLTVAIPRQPSPATRRAVGWLHGIVDALAGSRRIGNELKKRITSLFLGVSYIRNVPVPTNQVVWIQATATNAPKESPTKEVGLEFLAPSAFHSLNPR